MLPHQAPVTQPGSQQGLARQPAHMAGHDNAASTDATLGAVSPLPPASSAPDVMMVTYSASNQAHSLPSTPRTQTPPLMVATSAANQIRTIHVTPPTRSPAATAVLMTTSPSNAVPAYHVIPSGARSQTPPVLMSSSSANLIHTFHNIPPGSRPQTPVVMTSSSANQIHHSVQTLVRTADTRAQTQPVAPESAGMSRDWCTGVSAHVPPFANDLRASRPVSTFCALNAWGLSGIPFFCRKFLPRRFFFPLLNKQKPVVIHATSIVENSISRVEKYFRAQFRTIFF